MIDFDSFKRNRIHSDRVVFTDYDIVGNIKQLERLLIDFHSAIKGKYSSIATSLKENMDLYDFYLKENQKKKIDVIKL